MPISIQQSILILSLVIASGLALGSLRLRSIHLGIAGVLFSGLLFGHFGVRIDPQAMEFAQELGLILFVYTIGMQVGPGFFASLRRQGLPLNLTAALTVFLGVALTLLISRVAKIEMPLAVGLFAGATTNTPSLAAAQQALKQLPLPESVLQMPGLGYAISYPFGVLGVILSMIALRIFFRVNVQKEAETVHKLLESAGRLKAVNVQVQNQALEGMNLGSIPFLSDSGVVISRLLHEGNLQVAQPQSVLHMGDVLLLVGPAEALEKVRPAIGILSEIDLRLLPSSITSKRIILTRRGALGKTLDELDLRRRFEVTITRVSRAEVELAPRSDLRLQYGDVVLAVGEEEDIRKVAQELGDAPRQLDHPRVIPIFVGIALGVLLGGLPFHLPGLSSPVRLGLAGGPLVVAILLSRIGSIGPLAWYMPVSANFMLREVGVTLFLACVGLRSGDRFLATLLAGDGLLWMALAAGITLLPPLIVMSLARRILKLDYLTLCGLLAGSMTDPPALAYANAMAGSAVPAVSYATVYPLVMLLRVISAQALIFLSF